LVPAYRATLGRGVRKLFELDLIEKTSNFNDVTWLGHPIWQNVLDLWTIQEAIYEIKPELLIETGTNRGGSAMFYANLFDAMNGGEVVSIDVTEMHECSHPRVSFLIGSSTDESITAAVRERCASAKGPVMVILDSDHTAAHVARELECYTPFVTSGSYVLVQDGVIDTLPTARSERPGPLVAIKEFLARHPEFEVDHARSERFLITHHPLGWLRRRS
jgi:cephalosporin hydroxylase